MRVLTAGESHGPAIIAIVDSVPAGLPLTTADIDRDLARRQAGHGRGGRMKIEKDSARFLSGVRQGLTMGSPVTLLIENRDHANWESAMSPEAGAEPEKETKPRPGHGDLAGAHRAEPRGGPRRPGLVQPRAHRVGRLPVALGAWRRP